MEVQLLRLEVDKRDYLWEWLRAQGIERGSRSGKKAEGQGIIHSNNMHLPPSKLLKRPQRDA